MNDSSQELLKQCQGKMRRPKVDHRGRLVRDCEGNVELEDKETELKMDQVNRDLGNVVKQDMNKGVHDNMDHDVSLEGMLELLNEGNQETIKDVVEEVIQDLNQEVKQLLNQKCTKDLTQEGKHELDEEVDVQNEGMPKFHHKSGQILYKVAEQVELKMDGPAEKKPKLEVDNIKVEVKEEGNNTLVGSKWRADRRWEDQSYSHNYSNNYPTNNHNNYPNNYPTNYHNNYQNNYPNNYPNNYSNIYPNNYPYNYLYNYNNYPSYQAQAYSQGQHLPPVHLPPPPLPNHYNNNSRRIRLFVGNIPEGTTDDHLWALFGGFVSVIEANVVRNKNFGFVHFSTDLDRAGLDHLLWRLQGLELRGNFLHVKIGRKRDREEEGGLKIHFVVVNEETEPTLKEEEGVPVPGDVFEGQNMGGRLVGEDRQEGVKLEEV